MLKIFDPTTGELVLSVTGEGPVWFPTFDAAGSLVLAKWSEEDVVRLADAATGEIVGEVEGAPNDLALSPDGSKVGAVSSLWEPFAMIVDTATAEPLVEALRRERRDELGAVES